MLKQLRIQNFKCFPSLRLPLESLTLLTGFNAAGKSTSIQSILLIAQSLRSGNRSAKLSLNGPLTRLGSPGEVLYSGSGQVLFSMGDDSHEIEWLSEAEDRAHGVALRIRQVEIADRNGHNIYKDPEFLEMLLPANANSEVMKLVGRLRETIFLSAVRTGAFDVFPSPEDPLPVHADVGIHGEYAPWWFQRFLDEEVDETRCNPSDQATTLRRQFNAWANEFFPEAQGNVHSIEKTNLLRLELRIGDIGEWRRPSNIGYGLTYAFPIIVAGLLAKPNQILIIDSPEAHLHPAGQSNMGRFLSQIAAGGVQVIIETHSDHILNGIRLAVRNQNIDPGKVLIHFFNQPGILSVETAQVVSTLVDSQGNLSEWPKGFFDQSEKDMANLAGWG